MLLIAVPWYVLAEIKTPGFLHYFFIGEHWLRFVDSGWSGDLYGSAHARPRGSMWLLGFLAILPWSIVGLIVMDKKIHSTNLRLNLDDWQLYLLLWLLIPFVFFTFAGNILYTYVLPSVPALALLLAKPLTSVYRPYAFVGFVVPVMIAVFGPILIYDRFVEKSQQTLIADYRAYNSFSQIIYLYQRPYSAAFYSNGQARLALTDEQMLSMLAASGLDFVVVKNTRISKTPKSLLAKLEKHKEYPRYTLFREKELSEPMIDQFTADQS